MPASGYFIDANLILLLVMGSVSRDAIARHRRLGTFNSDDYQILINLINQVPRVLVTPNTLTKTSNLLNQNREPEGTTFFKRLRSLIEQTEEIVVASVDAAQNNGFTRLGLTDSALLEVASADTPIVTVDLALYLAALSNAPESALNFTHLQDL